MRPINFPLVVIALASIFLLQTLSAAAQEIQTDFGKNRVQYHNFKWQYYEGDNFNTYFYTGGQEIGKFVIQYAEKVVKNMESKLEYKLNKKINILVYNDITDYNMTNIGIGLDMENPGGVTKIIENKMFLYFNGNHNHLKKQIKRGIAKVFINNMMFGGNIQEVVQNAVLLNLPEWFKQGLVDYMAQPWSAELDNRMRDAIRNDVFDDFNELNNTDTRFAGHSVWHYIAVKYGPSSVPNLLYLTRINRSLESGFLFVFGKPVDQVLDEWYDFYKQKYNNEVQRREWPSKEKNLGKRERRNRHYYNPTLHPDGKHVAYASDIKGKTKVFIYNKETGKTNKVLKYGYKTVELKTDYSYPLLDWSPDGEELAIFYERKDNHKLMRYNMETGEETIREESKFQRILGMEYMNNKNNMVLSAMTRGQSDIFTYYVPTTRTEKITNDFYDDLNPSYVELNGKRGILFRSNRDQPKLEEKKLDTILPTDKMDLFFYDLDNKNNKAKRVTNTPHISEKQPMGYQGRYFTYLSDEAGIRNRYAGYFEPVFSHYDTVVHYYNNNRETWDSVITDTTLTLDSILRDTSTYLVDTVEYEPVYKDSAITFPITNYAGNIGEHDVNQKAGKYVETVKQNCCPEFYLHELPDSVTPSLSTDLVNTNYQDFREKQWQKEDKTTKDGESSSQQAKSAESDTSEKQGDDSERFFQSNFHYGPDISGTREEKSKDSEYKYLKHLSEVLPYQVKFSTEFLVTQVDNNSMILSPYEKFTGRSPSNSRPELSGMLRLGIADLMEDYKIKGGFRFPFGLRDPEFFISYEDLKRRIDHKYTYYRKVDSRTYSNSIPFYNEDIPQGNQPVEAKVKTNMFQYSATYPFDVIRSIRGHLNYRNDNFVFQSKNRQSLNLPAYNESWLISKLEYVHDNTIDIQKNIKSGLRYKVYWEFHKQFLMQRDTLFNSVNLDLPKFNNAYLSVIGADFRHYQKIHRNVIWANRFASSVSFGTRKLVYYLGGVDKWFRPQFNDNVPISEEQDYAFQTVAANLRGFQQNARNGSSYALINSEIRIPLFDYLIQSPIRSQFIKNFQVVGFGDIGTAWVGVNPYDENNPLNTNEFGSEPVEVEVKYFRNPIVGGYGVGVRTLLLGYFIRLDVSWGVDSGETKPPQWYFSLGLDF